MRCGGASAVSQMKKGRAAEMAGGNRSLLELNGGLLQGDAGAGADPGGQGGRHGRGEHVLIGACRHVLKKLLLLGDIS